MDGFWEDGRFVNVDTLRNKITALQARIKELESGPQDNPVPVPEEETRAGRGK